jgi:hypothetical protein
MHCEQYVVHAVQHAVACVAARSSSRRRMRRRNTLTTRSLGTPMTSFSSGGGDTGEAVHVAVAVLSRQV